MTTAFAPVELLTDELASLELDELTVAPDAESSESPDGPTGQPDNAGKVLLEDVDPNELTFTRNVRKAELDTEFVASIRENGLVQPIIATPHEDGIAIILGNRRAKGAIEAGRLVDVVVRNDLTTEQARIIAQLIENMHREDMKQSEIGDAYAQLSIELGLDAEEIATRVAQDPKKVRASIALAGMPKTARAAVDKGALTFEEAEALAEFEGDPKAYKRLLAKIENGHGLSWAIKDERRKAERAALRAETAQALAAINVRMVGEPQAFSWGGSREVKVDRLADADGVVLTPETHAACPGHAAFFNEHQAGDLKATFLCRDPHQYGHHVSGSYNFLSDEEQAAKAAAEQAARERREALAISQEVRVEYIQELCRSKKVPKGMTKKVLRLLYTLGADETSPEVLVYLNAPGDDDRTDRFERFTRRMAEARLPLVLLAAVAVRAERAVRQALSGYGDKWAALEWFDFLTAHGYPLTDPEIELVAELRAKIAESEARAAAKAAAEAARQADADEYDEDSESEEAEEESGEPELTAEEEPEEAEDELSRHLAIIAGTGPDDSGKDWEAMYPEINEPIAA
ncbi:ParB/RepB/Spo0J family partition protein [Kitasatospora cineracea]|uniref:ParB/RepB/Spo0J family partition protein n=1 Tax=Kitasatospora cineracea TaxID=88074 RepID=A0A8G1XG23_9ACTN|nr:ParB/RepB/Spo0J family partition protein [Kitasatospora cineracea]ROR44737.1 ParB/RepB/Spo0J family partition protein [Kitasatospora cineracea]